MLSMCWQLKYLFLDQTSSLTSDLYNCLFDISIQVSSRHLTIDMCVFELPTIPLWPQMALLFFLLFRWNLWGTPWSSPSCKTHIPYIMKAHWLYDQMHTESDYSLLLLYDTAEPLPFLWITLTASKSASLFPHCPL